MKAKTILLAGLSLFALSVLISAGPTCGSSAPDFTLTSVDGKTVRLADFKGKVVVLEWFNMGCPFVQRHYKDGHMQTLQSEYAAKGVVWLSINSTNPKHKDYRPTEKTVAEMAEHGIKCTAMLPDPDGKVGKAYGAKTTPHMFILDAEGTLVYQGAIDDDSSGRTGPKAAKNYVRVGLDETLAGKPVTTATSKQYGCSVKYAD